MSKLSTHILDTVLGKPAAGVRIRLEKLEGGGWIEVEHDKHPPERVRDAWGAWIEIASAVTDADGRCRELVADASAGTYRLTFETGAYLARSGRTTIYPEITITFLCSGEQHYHLPLLLSDNSYTTYRGS